MRQTQPVPRLSPFVFILLLGCFPPLEAADPGLVLHLPLDEGQGWVLSDRSGLGNQAIIARQGLSWIKGRSGKALEFPGGKGYVKLDKSQSLDITGPLTMMAWIRPATEWRPAEYAQILGIRDTDKAKHDAYSLGLRGDADGALRLNMAIMSDRLEESAVQGKRVLPRDKWSFVAGVYRPGKSMRVYVDGALDGERANAPAAINKVRYASALIGAVHRDRAGGHSFHGAIDEVMIYRDAPEEQAIRRIMAEGPGPTLLDALAKEEPLFSFGAVADVQYTDADASGERRYRHSLRKLKECVESFNRQDLAFVIQLGDLIDRDFDDFRPVLPVFRKLRAPRYHVLGNHDFPRDEEQGRRVWEYLEMPARYYDFSVKGWRFVVLDGNDISLKSAEEGSPTQKRALAILSELKWVWLFWDDVDQGICQVPFGYRRSWSWRM